jgi:hypothetical protein
MHGSEMTAVVEHLKEARKLMLEWTHREGPDEAVADAIDHTGAALRDLAVHDEDE